MLGHLKLRCIITRTLSFSTPFFADEVAITSTLLSTLDVTGRPCLKAPLFLGNLRYNDISFSSTWNWNEFITRELNSS